MELFSIAQEVLQNAAEHVASYRIGQNVLRFLDRALWTVEKSARWAVPPPLDQDERPQQELLRPLPWVFFLALLIFLRVIREVLSLVNLALGKPPLRSADMVSYIQSKRRYLRTLKYQGGRAMRARGGPSAYSNLRSLLDFTMCFRRHAKNNTEVADDEVMIVKRDKPAEDGDGCASETSMERLIEKMMADVDADSDDSHSYTLTGARSDKSDYTDSEHEIAFNKGSKTSDLTQDETGNFSKQNDMATSTPEKNNHVNDIGVSKEYSVIKAELNSNNNTKEENTTNPTAKRTVMVNGGTTKVATAKESSNDSDTRH